MSYDAAGTAPANGAPEPRDRGLSRLDLGLALVHGLAWAVVLMVLLLATFGAERLVELVQGLSPLQGERSDVASFFTAAGTLVLCAVVACGVWRARKPALERLGRADAALLVLAAGVAAGGWLVIGVGAFG